MYYIILGHIKNKTYWSCTEKKYADKQEVMQTVFQSMFLNG